MVENELPFEAVAEEIFHLLDGAYFVAHNIHFDLGFVRHELSEAGYEPPDVVKCLIRLSFHVLFSRGLKDISSVSCARS